MEKTDYYIQQAIQVAKINDPNLERNIEFFLNLNQVMQGYTDLLMKNKAGGRQKSITIYFLPRSSSSSDQPQSLPKQVSDESQPPTNSACVQAELNYLSEDKTQNPPLLASTPSPTNPQNTMCALSVRPSTNAITTTQPDDVMVY